MVLGITANLIIVKATNPSHCRSSFFVAKCSNPCGEFCSKWMTIGLSQMAHKPKDSHRNYGERSNDWVTLKHRCIMDMSIARMVHPSVRFVCEFQNIHHAQHFRLGTTQPMEENYKTHARKQHTRLLQNTVRFLKKTLSTPLPDSSRYLIRPPSHGVRR